MKEDGGPAFPQFAFSISGEPKIEMGMSLRDYFAATALVSIVRSKDKPYLEKDDAKWCYRVADAMLAERGRG